MWVHIHIMYKTLYRDLQRKENIYSTEIFAHSIVAFKNCDQMLFLDYYQIYVKLIQKYLQM